ncbi:MAG: hypothetical protein ACYDHH_00945 [Solirubrobacteraceae bacterium]
MRHPPHTSLGRLPRRHAARLGVAVAICAALVVTVAGARTWASARARAGAGGSARARVGAGAAARRHPHAGTCGTFCRQAGGLGGNPGVAPCTVVGSVIRVVGGVAPLRVRCFGRHTSRGALVIYPHDFLHQTVADGVPSGSFDGVDLVIAARHTVTLYVRLSRKALALLERKRTLLVDVLIELNTRPVVQASMRSKVPMVL